MKEVEKTSIQRTTNNKRERRRKRFLPLFYFAVAILVLIFAVTLSMTVLFNIKTIYIEGSSEYEASQIVEASEIYKGDNLVRLNTEEAKQKILKNLMYIDDVTIKKEFPDKIVIQTVASVPAMNIKSSTDDEYMLVSEGLKLLYTTSTPQEDLINVIGFEPSVVATETKLQSEDEQKIKILETIYDELKNQNMLQDIISLDLTDKYNIQLNYQDRIYVVLGSYSDLEYKIKYANTVITQNISTQKSGYLVFVNSKEASFVEKEEYEDYLKRLEEISNSNSSYPADDTTETSDIITSSSEFYTDTQSTDYYGYDTTTTTMETQTQEVTTISTTRSNLGEDAQIVYGSQSQ